LLMQNDFNSLESAFANMLQVAGRAGRGSKKGRVIIETTQVDNYCLEAIKNNDYIQFYKKEIEHRKRFDFPPYIDILEFEFTDRNYTNVKKEAQRLYEILSRNNRGRFKIYTPKSPYISKINNRYKVSITLKCKLTKIIYGLIYKCLNEYYTKSSKVSLKVLFIK